MESPQLERLKQALSGHYRFERELGEGAFATVFLAQDLRLERPVAIKVLHVDPISEVSEIRFLREVRFLANLQHPNIVPVHDSGHLENLLYYVMPYIRGESLRQRIRREGRLAVRDAIRITCEIGDAVDTAHNAGIIHRDIKPENILISGAHPLLADFGVARALNDSSVTKVTQKGFGSPGTPAYMSPEQLLGEEHIDQRADIYSLGCVLYEMLTGHAPFEGSGGFVKRFTEAAPSSRELRPEVSTELDKVVQTALGRTPSERFRSAADMCTSLSAAGAETPGDRVENKGDSSHAAPARDSHYFPAVLFARRPIALGMILLLLIIGAFTIAAWARRSSESPATPDPRRIAVLDFEDQSPGHTLGYLASGLSVSLTQELSAVNALQVLSRNSFRSLESRGASVDSVIQVLRVGSLIEGSLQRSGDKLRLTVQIVDAPSGTQIESATIERSFGELFLLEDDLAHQAAVLLRRRLGVQIHVQEASVGTSSAQARDLVFRADKLREDADSAASSADSADFAWAEHRLKSADSLLAMAEASDKDWVRPIIDRGWVAIALARGESNAARAADFERAIRYANRALAKDTADAAALELRGTALYWQVVRLDMPDSAFNDRLSRATTDLTRAVAIDSTRSRAWGTLSLVRFARGDVGEAVRAGRTALAMDTYLSDAPTIMSALYTANLMEGKWGEASRWCDIGGRDYPRDYRFWDCKLTLLAEDPTRQPNPQKAWATVRAVNELDPPLIAQQTGRQYLPTYREMMVAMVLARVRQGDSARAVARRAYQAVERDTSLHSDFLYDDAYLHLLLGERDEALRSLSEYLSIRPSLRTLVSKHRRWQPLWDDVYFKKLISAP
ncbi:MAG TPA: serine/threonine-protein kinase [Gemmatimonadaceae bacterium]|nr:serine/threonine-protein kinase [Gemmatimonadaceae bacterium]